MERTVTVLSRRSAIISLAALVGLLAGALVARKTSDAILLCIAIVGVLGLAMLGERAFPWAVVIVAVAPWYPLIAGSGEVEGPIVKQKVFCAAIAAAALLPWLWSLALGGRRTRPSRGALLMGVLFGSLGLLIYETNGSASELINTKVVGFLFIGVTFLCARRFGDGRGWLAASFGGLALLLLMGVYVYLKAPSDRVGYFVGYPITYGALIVGLLPAALLFTSRRSHLLAGAVAVASAALLVFSESRSAWIAVTVVLVVVVALQARAGNYRALAYVASIVVILAALIVGSGSLHKVIERRLNSSVASSQSVTHREFSYGYAFRNIEQRPIFGAGAPGFSGEESANKTTIGALDNGYLSISVDMGLIGLFAAIIPIGVALRVLGRCLRFGVAPQLELALVLGIIGMAVVTIFYDSFYWAQIDLLLGGMGGVLSTRIARIAPVTASAPGLRPAYGRRARVKLAL